MRGAGVANGAWRAIVLLVVTAAVMTLSGLGSASAAPSSSQRALALVSTTSVGATADGWEPDVSRNGRWIVFTSNAAALVPAGSGQDQVFRKDTYTGQVDLVSVAAGSSAGGNADSVQPAISAGGRWVAFASRATNLVKASTGGHEQIFVRDMNSTAASATRLVSVSGSNSAGDGDSSTPSVSASGTRIAFTSFAGNLTADTYVGWGGSNVFVRDTAKKQTRKVSINSYGNNAAFDYPNNAFLNAASGPAALSDDGRFVTFSGSTFGGALDSAPCTGTYEYVRAFLYDWNTNVDPVDPPSGSVPSVGEPAVFGCGALPAISGDGSHVAFFDQSNGLTTYDVSARSAVAHPTADPDFDGSMHDPSLNTTGTASAFTRVASSGVSETYEINLASDHMTLISRAASGKPAGAPGDGGGWWQTAGPGDDDGVVFNSSATNLAGSGGGAVQVFQSRRVESGPLSGGTDLSVAGRGLAETCTSGFGVDDEAGSYELGAFHCVASVATKHLAARILATDSGFQLARAVQCFVPARGCLRPAAQSQPSDDFFAWQPDLGQPAGTVRTGRGQLNVLGALSITDVRSRGLSLCHIGAGSQAHFSAAEQCARSLYTDQQEAHQIATCSSFSDVCSPDFTWEPINSWGGDSGGPVYAYAPGNAGVYAVGIVIAGGGSKTAFLPIGEVLSRLGVSLLLG